jgi:mRNA interferase HicA
VLGGARNFLLTLRQTQGRRLLPCHRGALIAQQREKSGRQTLHRFEARHGKGSHRRLYYGERFTTVKDRKKEIGPGLLQKMLADLGLSRNDLEE